MISKRELWWKVREVLPDWGPVGWTVFGLAALVLAMTGISLFYTPRDEVLYSLGTDPFGGRAGARCLFYRVEVGNTGRRVQEDVKLHFLKAAMDRIEGPPSVLNSGVAERPYQFTKDENGAVLGLGALEPGKRVTIRFVLIYPKGEEPHAREQILVRVEPARGRAREGDPGLAQVGRAWFSLFTSWLPF